VEEVEGAEVAVEAEAAEAEAVEAETVEYLHFHLYLAAGAAGAAEG